MGQGYNAVILSDDGKIIRTWVNPHAYNNGYKLIEHSYVSNNFVQAVESLICPTGMFYKSRIVWAGDYADEEPEGKNLNTLAEQNEDIHSFPRNKDMSEYLYVVNHTKQEYMSKGNGIHCLPLMTAEGNGRGGGDYYGQGEELVGTWARDVISVEKEVPGYREVPNVFQRLPIATQNL